MGNSFSASCNHIAEDHIHKNITCNIEESQQRYRLGTVRIDYWEGAQTRITGSKPSPLVSAVLKTFGPHEGFLAHK